MSLTAKIAFRNIRRHKTKTIIIGTLILIGMTVLIVGNSLMDSAARGIGQTYVDSYTGDIVITGRHSGGLSLIGFENETDLDAVIPTVPAVDDVMAYAAGHPDVQAVNPQATTMMLVDYGDRRGFTAAFGIDPVLYEEMFSDNIEIIRGRMLLPGEEGIVLAAEVADQLERADDEEVVPGDTVLLTGMSQAMGIKVREVPVRGIFRFRRGNPQVDYVSLMDIGNVRALAGMNVSAVTEDDLVGSEAVLFGEIDETALFGGTDDALVRVGSAGAGLVQDGVSFGGALDEEMLLADLFVGGGGDVVVVEDSKAWHFVLVRLRDGADADGVIADFHHFFDENAIDAMAWDWLSGAGIIAQLATGTKIIFNVIVFVIAVVAVIIIMNTLVISVTERTTEIGTMRALGAQKKLVRRMIVGETMMTSGIFGTAGIAIGVGIIFILRATGIEAPNVFFEVLFGGPVLRPVPSLGAIGMSFVVILFIGAAASLYPVSVALKTKPIEAMQE